MRSSLNYMIRLAAVAFAIRIALIVVLRDPFAGPTGGPTGDAFEFDSIAQNIATGVGFCNHGRPTSFRAPGYPFLIGLVYFLFGIYPLLVYLLNAALGAASCILAYLIGRDLFDECTGQRAGWLGAFFLPHIWFATMFHSENLFIPLLGMATWLLSRWPMLSAVNLGLAVLTRPFAIVLIPLWALWHLANRRYRAAMAFGMIAGLCIVPWTVRNFIVHGKPVLIATNGGSTFYGGNNDRVIHEWRLWGGWISTTELPFRDLIDATPDEVAHDRMEWKLGTDWVIANPVKAVLSVPFKLARLLFWLPDFEGGRIALLIRIVTWVPYLVLILASLRRVDFRAVGWILHMAMIATAITAVVFWGSPRFRDANAPLLMVYASMGWSVLFRETVRNS